MRQAVPAGVGLDTPRKPLGTAAFHRQVATRADAQSRRPFGPRMPPDSDIGAAVRAHARAYAQSAGNSGAIARNASSAPSSTTCCVAPSVSPV